ncbi:MAG: DUF4125 family protein [Coriobacteriales bacterium]|jgi:hypothetical protein|nr:DUF4125 family protein [Coriobacteriales bacterium]
MDTDVQIRAREATLDELVEREWQMFETVNEKSGIRASCQEDKASFAGMRRSQFAAWSEEAAVAYLADLKEADEAERNLLAEKYLYMMLVDTPILDEEYLRAVPMPSENTYTLCEMILDIVLRQTEELRLRYPRLGRRGRPLFARDATPGVTSIQTYQLGELLTYSETTLFALLRHLQDVEEKGGSTAEEILANEMRFYGYDSLEQAEKMAQWQDEGDAGVGDAGVGDAGESEPGIGGAGAVATVGDDASPAAAAASAAQKGTAEASLDA